MFNRRKIFSGASDPEEHPTGESCMEEKTEVKRLLSSVFHSVCRAGKRIASFQWNGKECRAAGTQ